MAVPPPHHPPTLGVVLAGGLARRMGGGDKGLAAVGGRPILDRIARRVAPQVTALALNANGSAGRFAALGLPVLPDTVPGRPGPLAGVLAGMEAAAAAGLDWVLTVPCDAPFLPPDLVARLHAANRGAGAAAASGGRRHPTAALWPAARRDELRRLLVEEDVRRVVAVLERFGFATADWDTAPFDPFLNVNDAEGLRTAQAVAERLPLA